MGILDSIKDLANQTVDNIKEVTDAVQEKATELKADFDKAGGAEGLLKQAENKLTELGEDISVAASKAADTATETVAELKTDFDKAGGAKGLFDKASDTVKDAIKNNDHAPKA